ncbi:sulfatase-like hydrolase/transferase [Maribacter sp. 2307ULW6-5]|uniref:sulfatase-like hydrolase/transferase n=1 Tax=Maribacter sp. 2307ULW6-5 TaxID=3386275 RepID=UPI0039BC51F3
MPIIKDSYLNFILQGRPLPRPRRGRKTCPGAAWGIGRIFKGPEGAARFWCSRPVGALALFCFLAGGHFLAYAQTANGKGRQKPNVILILADDLGYADLGLTGSKQLKTPHLDALAKNGVFFSQAYVSAPVCSPSRAGLLTGINQVSFGHDNNLGGNQPGFDPDFLGLPLSQKTIADHLSELGYVCGLIGKWHLGDTEHFHPLKRGFQEFWGYTGGGHDYFRSEPGGKGYLSPLQSNFKTPQAISYLTDDKGDECAAFIERNKERPFFLFASFNAPHAPMQATEQDKALFDHIPDEKRRTYAAMVHRLDVNVGKIMDALQEQGLAQHTLVVFLSDNGGPVAANASLNAPYRGSKGTLLEGGLHVPLIMHWPGTLPKGKVYGHSVSALDLAPTFLAMAGADNHALPSFSGTNLLPYVLGEATGAPHPNLKWRFTISAAIREGNWKLIRLPDRLPLLYHLPTDSSELKDLSLENVQKTKALLKQLGDWDVALPHPVFLEGAVWKKRQLELYDAPYNLRQPQ